MNVKRYLAPTSREALARVKKELGADAVILANRQTGGGVEILALAHRDVGAVTRPAPVVERPLKEIAKKIEKPAPAAVQQQPQQDLRLLAEMKAMRGLVESHLATIAWNDEARRDPLRAQ